MNKNIAAVLVALTLPVGGGEASTAVSVPYDAHALTREDIMLCEEEAHIRMQKSQRGYSNSDLIESGVDILVDLLNDRDLGSSLGREARTGVRGASRDYERYERARERMVDRCLRKIEREERNSGK